MTDEPCIVDAAWLKEKIEAGAKNIVVADGTWHLPVWKRNAEEEHKSCRIKGAVRFDLTKIKDTSNPLPFMMPPPEHFEDCVGKLGISNDSHVVVYDNNSLFGGFSAARVWFMFHAMGHKNVSMLNGGLPEWNKNGGQTESGPPNQPEPVSYKATFKPELTRSFDNMMDNLKNKKEAVVDGRSSGRYNGTAPEPNPTVPSGHMIGSCSLPFTELLDQGTKLLKSQEGMKEAFAQRGVDLSQPSVCMCGSGLTACWISFAAHCCGLPPVALYDGSWFEWQKKAPEDLKTKGVKGEDLPKN
uniref:Sulfurtransferase n=1 Tax=Halisarca dujardinii TaxID=2583056 RepID=A0A6C0PMX6_HALDU|nr:thiosulfate/3-mercaptopyruvate sulfurtransferase [Halisarca dujardinii]